MSNAKKPKKSKDDLLDSLLDDLKAEAASESTMMVPAVQDEPQQETIAVAHGNAPSDEPSQLAIVANDETVHVAEKPRFAEESGMFEKTAFGKASMHYQGGSAAATALDAHLQQADALKLAQNRILDLEKHLEKMRSESEQLSAVADMARVREEELLNKIHVLDRSRSELKEHSMQELNIFRDNLQNREFEVTRLRMRLEEMESRLQSDLKKIRVRERELENRLELSKMEKTALLKAKDDTILDLKRKQDQIYTELDAYRHKCLDLNRKIELNNDQFSRTVRALRLALTNLEANENQNTSTMTVTALKKAE
jgi:chromosome segregation ATPase